MIKKYSVLGSILCLLILTSLFFSCEKDDICVEGTITTPLLVIEFFDANNTSGEEVAKNVTKLWVEAVNPNTDDNGVILDPIQLSPQTTNTVSIPLRTQDDSTQYRFISNYELDDMGGQLGNEDIITFNYTTREIFLSRACGYITNYTMNVSNGAVVTDDGNNWINPAFGIQVSEINIQNENVTHVKIYH